MSNMLKFYFLLKSLYDTALIIRLFFKKDYGRNILCYLDSIRLFKVGTSIEKNRLEIFFKFNFVRIKRARRLTVA